MPPIKFIELDMPWGSGLIKNTVDIEGMNVSRLCLGTSKFVDLDVSQGVELIKRAVALDINIFDSHNRYGCGEQVLGDFDDIVKMTKVSAYQSNQFTGFINSSMLKMKEVDIFWVSDLDDLSLYNRGVDIHKKLPPMLQRKTGITTESIDMGYKFLKQFPEVKYYMIPFNLYVDVSKAMDFIRTVKDQGKYVFAIKPFRDMYGLSDYHKSDIPLFLKDSLQLAFSCGIDVVCFGTRSLAHLEQTINISNGEWYLK